ncbi:probable G-protein coupled receptor Mth-like 1 [Zootermopsis nevadensis]|nr:probable G-protein coupled receptor Mth-like 1 [Zootermopsis nevadensis]
MCLPEFGADDEEEYSQGLGYITLVGLSLSIGFLILHLFAFGLTPRLHNLSSMNLACLSVTLLLVYCSFFGSVSLKETGIPCVSIAVIIHYSLLASFFWMLTIAYDINRVLRVATTKLLVSTGRHWHRFGVYCLWSWIVPAVIVGVALAAEFSSDGVLEYVRPGYGVSECWFDSGRALLTFIVGPLSVVMILNAVLFFWSACIIYTSTSELKNTSRTHRDFRLYCRLALIMGLTWIVGLVAAFVDNIVVWYAFVILNTLQGLFIFLAFTCTQKVWQELRPYRQTQAYAPSPATMYT